MANGADKAARVVLLAIYAGDLAHKRLAAGDAALHELCVVVALAVRLTVLLEEGAA